jgi:hypothetical protein
MVTVGDSAFTISKVRPEFIPRDSGEAVATLGQMMAAKTESADAVEGDHEAAVTGFLKIADPAGASDAKKLSILVNRLHHADQPSRRAKSILDHGKIARLKDVQRQLALRQKQRVWKRENRNLRWQCQIGIALKCHWSTPVGVYLQMNVHMDLRTAS